MLKRIQDTEGATFVPQTLVYLGLQILRHVHVCVCVLVSEGHTGAA